MVLMLSFLALQAAPKPSAIMNSVIAKYKALKTLECSYKSTGSAAKKEIYSGTVSYKKNHHMNFSISDNGVGCSAGEELNAKGQGSTWVSPPDQRGYNDTLMDRHPYLIVRLIRDETKGNMSEHWLDNVEKIKRGKQTLWRIRAGDDSDLAMTIDANTYLIAEFSSAEGYHSGSRLTTFIHYK